MSNQDQLSVQNEDEIIQGHDADGITEFDNDLPLWWFVGFIFTIVFAVGYWVNYEMAEGLSTKAEYEAEVAEFNKSQEPPDAQKAKVELAALTDAPSIEAGKTLFNGQANMCYTCHRNDLGGVVGPNLTDEFWIHGGDFKSVMNSIKAGYPDKGMQPYGSGAKLTERQVQQLASFIASMKDSHPVSPKAIDPAREIKWEEHEDEEHDEIKHETKKYALEEKKNKKTDAVKAGGKKG